MGPEAGRAECQCPCQASRAGWRGLQCVCPGWMEGAAMCVGGVVVKEQMCGGEKTGFPRPVPWLGPTHQLPGWPGHLTGARHA